MVFLCQKDSYLTSVITKVLSCKRSEKFKEQFEVEFDKALVFPEGGGQPSDHATVWKGDTSVGKVTGSFRDAERAVAIVDGALSVDEEFKIELDFKVG